MRGLALRAVVGPIALLIVACLFSTNASADFVRIDWFGTVSFVAATDGNGNPLVPSPLPTDVVAGATSTGYFVYDLDVTTDIDPGDPSRGNYNGASVASGLSVGSLSIDLISAPSNTVTFVNNNGFIFEDQFLSTSTGTGILGGQGSNGVILSSSDDSVFASDAMQVIPEIFWDVAMVASYDEGAQTGTGAFAAISIDSNISFYTVTTFVPIPAAAWLFVSGLLGLLGCLKRRTA